MSMVSLISCQTLNSTDSTSLAFNIPSASTLRLNKNLEIKSGNTHVVIQNGNVITESTKDLYQLSCRLEMEAFGPRTITPDTFKVKRTEDDQEQASGPSIIRYSTEIFLYSDHNSDIIKLDCSVWGDRLDGHFPVSKIQKTLGDYFSFNFNSKVD